MKYEPFVYADAMRKLEAHAVENGMSYLQLMENAGSGAANYLMDHGVVCAKSSVLILCGKGNNGGDGYVMARCFAKAFHDRTVTVLALGDPQTPDAQTMCERAQNLPNIVICTVNDEQSLARCFGDILLPTVVIDAVYGIGFHGGLPKLMATLFERVRLFRAFCVAVDLPSGMEADSGLSDVHCFNADLTLTFTSKKRGMLTEEAASCCGKTVVCAVGIPDDLTASYQVNPVVITNEIARFGVPVRRQHSHKGVFGSVYALCGSYGMAGASMLAAKAALRCGVGLVHCFVPKSIYPIVASQIWEAVYHPLDETAEGTLSTMCQEDVLSLTAHSKGAFLCGPGLSRCEQTTSLLRKILPQIFMPLVLDADGLNAFIGHIDEWKAMSANGTTIVLTPHPVEAARLLSCTVAEIEQDRILSAKKLADATGAVVVLKGHETVIADLFGNVFINVIGCSGLAKGGSGDVLSGMIAALLAQGVGPCQACVTAVFLHGLASVRTADRLSETGMLPTDLLDELAVLLSEFEQRE